MPVQSWPLIPDASSPSTSPASSSSTNGFASKGFAAFLGFGLIVPFRRDLKNDFASAGGLELVKSCVAQVLGTRASSEVFAGELPWRPEFGSLIYLAKHRKGDLLNDLVRVWASDALTRWEPRVLLKEVTADFDRTTRVLTAQILYDVIESNVAGNNVIFPDVEQDLVLPIAA